MAVRVRRRVSAVLRDYTSELARLQRFDADNQIRFAAGLGSGTSLSRKQLHLLTESIFFAAFRAHETFIREVFLLYCLEKQTASGAAVASFLKPRDYTHAEQLIQSGMPFLDWASPDVVIDRSELYLDGGGPVKRAYTANLDAMRDYKRIRNHVAHGSPQSLNEFAKVVRKYYGTLPLAMPSPGELLLYRDRRPPHNYQLQKCFDVLQGLAASLT